MPEGIFVLIRLPMTVLCTLCECSAISCAGGIRCPEAQGEAGRWLHTMAVAVDTFSDSDVLRPVGKFGISNLSVINEAHPSLIPLPSFPITISPFGVRVVEYISSPSRNVP